MANTSGDKRIDTASKVIMASPQKIYEAFLDPQALASWRPPEGMKCHVYGFNPYEGDSFRMSFGYIDTNHEVRGKTSADADVFQGRFLELIRGRRIVELIEFESNDPAFAGTMTITTNLEQVPEGTRVTFIATNVPVGIGAEDHYKGMISTLNNLAAFTE